MRILLLTSILLALWAGGCDKIGKTRVSGRVVNAITNEPIPNVTIWGQAFVCKGSCLGTGSTPVSLFATQTDSEGYFEAESNERGDDPVCYIYTEYDDTLKFFASSPEYGTMSSTKLSLHEDNEIEFRVVPRAYLYFSLKNVNYQDETDEIAYRMANYQLNWGTAPGDTNIFRGMMDASSGSIPVPMGWLVFTWDVTRNGQTARFRDSIWCKSGSSNTFTINY